MELGEKLRAARLEAGLSQRQLCENIITRNMLSQIENGSARPSRSTLQALCARLGKPMGYFVEEEAPSENLGVLHKAYRAEPGEALELLKQYLKPDPVLDEWYEKLWIHCALAAAEKALQEGQHSYARQLLKQCQVFPKHLSFLRQWLLLQFDADPRGAAGYAGLLPDNTREQLLRAQAALDQGNAEKCLACLDCADTQPAQCQLLRSQALIKLGKFEQAKCCLEPLEAAYPQQILPLLEQCARETGDFEQAYYYACKQR